MWSCEEGRRRRRREWRMGWTMGLNLVLLMAMVATNLFSVYHLSTTVQSTIPSTSIPIPNHLLHQLSSLRSSISRLTPSTSTSTTTSTSSTPPSDLLIYSSLSPIASACNQHPSLLHSFMNYTPFSPCPRLDPTLVESLLLLGCHPLPRRRCFSTSNPPPSTPLPREPFPLALPDSAVLWSKYSCKSFSCLNHYNSNLGFDMPRESSRFTSYSDELDLPVSQLVTLARSAGIPLRVGIDVGGGTGSFAAAMKRDYNATVVTTTMNLGAPYSEAAAIRGVVPMHVPLQQRLPVFDGTMDLVRCGRAVNRWIPDVVLEFMLFDFDRVLRGGGYLWLDHFFSKEVSLEKVYKPLIGKLGYKKVKWAVVNKTDTAGIKNKEVYLTALLQKPMSR